MTASQFNAGILGALLAVTLMCGITLIAAEVRKRIRLSIRAWQDIRLPKMERRYINLRKRIERRRRVAAKPTANTVHVAHDPGFIPEWVRDKQVPRLLQRHWA